MTDNQTPKQPSFQISCPCMTCSGYCVCGIAGHHNQPPESRELRRNLNIAVMANYPGTTASPQFLDDCMMFITTATQASNKALLNDVEEVIDNYFKQFGSGMPLKIAKELSALKRQQLGKESSDE